MEKYTEILRGYLGTDRKCTKVVFKLAGRIYRGVNNGRFTLNEILESLKKEGAVNER